MVNIEIRPEDGALYTRTFTFTDKKTGEQKDGEERSQTAYLHSGGPYPQRFKLRLGRDQHGYEPGLYAVNLSCVVPGRFDGLQFKNILDLTPVENSKSRAA
jgi:hypothetical protein